jgi:histidinol-phosphatase (PHP family)
MNSGDFMLYDSHTHTTNSDGRNSLEEMCCAAVEAGVAGITITDHADMNFFASRDTYNRIKGCIEQVGEAQQTYQGKLDLLCGVELGEFLYEPESAKKILNLTEYDAVLCSVHLVPAARWEQPYNRIPFSEDGTDAELDDYLRLYFDLVSETVDSFDFDVLAHLSCPVRYMTGLHERKTDVMRYESKLREILQKIIDRNIALEWNTGGMNARFHYYSIQNEEIFELYRSMGGQLITLGSDAHSIGGICNGFGEARDALKRCGFTHYHYFKDRKPQCIAL